VTHPSVDPRAAARVALCLALGLACACGDRDAGAPPDEAGSPPTSAADVRPPPPAEPVPSRWGDEEPEVPSVSVLANRGAATLPRGWPLVVELQVLHPRSAREDAAPMTVALAAGPWSDAVRLEVRDASGRPQSWPLGLEGEGAATLELDAWNGGLLAWTLSAEETAALADGRYQIGARLETRGRHRPGAWEGEVIAPPVLLDVVAEPVPLPPEREPEKLLTLAAYHQARGDAAQAEAALDRLLERRPDDVAALVWKAELAAQSGRNPEALALYDKAIGAAEAARPDAPEPPAALLRGRAAVLERLIVDD
jgi:hypothetical protein